MEGEGDGEQREGDGRELAAQGDGGFVLVPKRQYLARSAREGREQRGEEEEAEVGDGVADSRPELASRLALPSRREGSSMVLQAHTGRLADV